jgi:hypothetical protein
MPIPYVLGAKVWVDNNGEDLWTVLQKQEVFSQLLSLSAEQKDVGEQYGSSVAQAQNKLAILVGSAKYRLPVGATEWNIANAYATNAIVYVTDPFQSEFYFAPAPVPQGTPITDLAFWTPYSLTALPRRGAVYVYVKSSNDVYTPINPTAPADAVLTLDVLDVSGGPLNGQTAARDLGTSADFGNQTWAVSLVHLAVLAVLAQWTMAMPWSYSEIPCWANQVPTPMLPGNC